MLVVFFILAALAVVAFFLSRKEHTKETEVTGDRGYGTKKVQVPDPEFGKFLRFASFVLAGVALVFLLFTVFYRQGVGEAKVVVDWAGNISGSSTTSGLHVKAPWDHTVNYDVRNNVVTYVGDGNEGDHSGGNATGNQITVQDKDGTTANVDIVVRYSLDPTQVERTYARFGSQDSFVSKVITNDVRSVTRNAPATYTALEFLNKREQVGNEIQNELEKRWSKEGIIVDEVQLQEIRYDESVRARFNEAQNSRTAIAQAQADLETARVNAEKAAAEAQGRADAARIEAQGQADANATLSASLTPQVLQQRYLDALKDGTVFVVPQGSDPLVQVPAPAAK